MVSRAEVMLRDRLRDHAGKACSRNVRSFIQVNLDETGNIHFSPDEFIK